MPVRSVPRHDLLMNTQQNSIELTIDRSDIAHVTCALIRLGRLPAGFAECAMDPDGAVLRVALDDAQEIAGALKGTAVSGELSAQLAAVRRAAWRVLRGGAA